MNSAELISAKQIDSLIEQRSVLLIDLRQEQEYRYSHIRTAVNIPYEKFCETENWETFRGRQIILYCDRGGASLSAVRLLEKHGIRAKSMSGGFGSYRGRNLVFSFQA